MATMRPYVDGCDESTRDPCAAEEASCACEQFERLRFWDGRFLVARDLRDFQVSLIRRTALHQQLAHGAGVVCGFEITRHHDEINCPDVIVISPGVAYDCCGRTLQSCQRRLKELHLPDVLIQDESDESGKYDYDDDDDEPGTAPRPSPIQRPERTDDDVGAEVQPSPVWERFLVVRRKDVCVDPVPALYAEDLCDPVRQEFGRIREDVEFALLESDHVSERWWPRRTETASLDCVDPVEDDCGETPGTVECFTECPPGHGVILARLLKDPRSGLLIETEARPVVVTRANLTRVVGISWPHGGSQTIDDLPVEPEDRVPILRVHFSRPLQPDDQYPGKIDPHIFSVSYIPQIGQVHTIVADPDDPGSPGPRLSPNRRCLVFRLPRHLFGGRVTIEGSTIFVKLRCDFLIDCHGRAVSGAHIAGDVNRRGSGNGVEGGLFESWFHLALARGR